MARGRFAVSLVAWLLTLAAVPLSAQVISEHTIAANAISRCVPMANVGAIGIRITGTFVGDIAVREASSEAGADAVTLPAGTVLGDADSLLTATGFYSVPNLGLRFLCAVSTSWSSGTATVVFTRGIVSAGSAGAGDVFLEAMAADIEEIVNNPGTETTRGNAMSGKGTPVHARAVSNISTIVPVDDDDAMPPTVDPIGRLVTVRGCDRTARIGGVDTDSAGDSTAVVAAGGAGVFHEIWDVVITNTHATQAVTVEIEDGVAGTILAVLPVPPATSGVVFSFSVPLTGSANTAIAVDPSPGAATVYTTLRGCKVQ